jgi:hypothetical protein
MVLPFENTRPSATFRTGNAIFVGSLSGTLQKAKRALELKRITTTRLKTNAAPFEASCVAAGTTVAIEDWAGLTTASG